MYQSLKMIKYKDPPNQQLGRTPVQARGILQLPEEQSRTGGCQGSTVEGQPKCPRLWHSSTPNARSLSHSPSAPPPSFTQSPYPPRSLVRDEQTHPHRPRLVVSHSTCPSPPLSSPPGPPGPREQLCNRSCSNKAHTPHGKFSIYPAHPFLFCTVQYCPRWSREACQPHRDLYQFKKDPTLFDGLGLIRAGTNTTGSNSAPLL